MIKLGRVISYLKKIQKINISFVIPLFSSIDISIFSPETSSFRYREIQVFSVLVPRHKSRLFYVNVFLRHYGGQLTAVQNETGEKMDKDNNKVKKELKIPSFCAVFNCSNCASREKDKSICRFSSIFKNDGKEGLKLSKTRSERWLAQIFRKYLTERKLKKIRARIKIIFSAPPSSVFSQRVYNFIKR